VLAPVAMILERLFGLGLRHILFYGLSFFLFKI
jgi:hypothetical protein